MPARARSETVELGVVAVYHCWNRCVRRAFLCGKDPLTGVDYEYRRGWIRSMQALLAGLFAIEVGFRAELVNHIHAILRTRPDIVETWSDKEVVRRWLTIAKLAKSRDGKLRAPNRARIALELAIPGRVDELRERLADPSYFMGTLCEYIGRRSNREDGCRGVFWEERYKCRDLADEAAILVCGIYVDLNQIRAGEASTPEQSTHTSAFDRIRSRQPESADARDGSSDAPLEATEGPPDGWLCELTLDEREPVNSPSMLRSASGRRASDKGLLPVSLDHYLELLDLTGRTIQAGKKSGAIPAHLAPILKRLGVRVSQWFEAVAHFEELFGHIVGKSQTIVDRAAQAGRKTYHGRSACSAVFG